MDRGISADEKRLTQINKDIARLQKKADNIQKYIDIAKSDQEENT